MQVLGEQQGLPSDRCDFYPGMTTYYDATLNPVIKLFKGGDDTQLSLETDGLVTYTYEELEKIISQEEGK